MGNKTTDVERKYQVFISSTFKDLAEERQAAKSAIIKAGHLPIALEDYAPDTKDKATVIRTAINACQFYVLILGHRYGYRPKRENGTLGPSYVEMELDWAEEANLPILAFLLDEDLAREKRGQLAGPRAVYELNSEDDYWNLRKRFTEGPDTPFYKPFIKSSDIYPELYAYFSRPHSVPGYILEPKDWDATSVVQIARNEVLQAVVKRLGRFEKVERRLSFATPQKRALGKAFNELHGGHIERKYEKVFFESGSTLVYIAEQLAKRLPKKSWPDSGGRIPTILTNNAFAYIYLWLCQSIMCHPEPQGPPDEEYAGMYGPLADYDRVPDYDLRGLQEYDPEGANSINKLNEKIFGPPEENSHTLILAAMSGLQLSDQINAVYVDDDGNKRGVDKSDNIYKKLAKCRGFHVGSYPNKLFKRCLYLSKAATVFFIHDTKIDCEIEVGKCHFIFDKDDPWEKFIVEHPMSLWVGCTGATFKEVLQECRSHIGQGSWKFTVYGEASFCPIVIGHNKCFREACNRVGVTLLS